MDTDTVCLEIVLEELLGNNNFNAFGLIKVEVSMKNTNNRKTISVIDDILKLVLTLFLERKFIMSSFYTAGS